MKEFFAKYFDLSDVDTRFFGALFAIVPVFTIINLLLGDLYYIGQVVGFCLTVVVLAADIKVIENHEYKAPSFWWILITPVYIWKRDNATKKANHKLFWAYLLTILLSFLVATGLSYNGVKTEMIGDSSCAIIDTMSDVKANNLKCIKVTDVKEVTTDFYSGIVLFSDNSRYTISSRHDTSTDQLTVSLGHEIR